VLQWEAIQSNKGCMGSPWGVLLSHPSSSLLTLNKLQTAPIVGGLKAVYKCVWGGWGGGYREPVLKNAVMPGHAKNAHSFHNPSDV